MAIHDLLKQRLIPQIEEVFALAFGDQALGYKSVHNSARLSDCAQRCDSDVLQALLDRANATAQLLADDRASLEAHLLTREAPALEFFELIHLRTSARPQGELDEDEWQERHEQEGDHRCLTMKKVTPRQTQTSASQPIVFHCSPRRSSRYQCGSLPR
jgi:hypothetical protein